MITQPKVNLTLSEGVSHHCLKFDAYRFCRSGDITLVFFHVTLRAHMIKGICDSVSGIFSAYVTTVSRLMVIVLIQVKTKLFIKLSDIS